jgi:hypothetical protein
MYTSTFTSNESCAKFITTAGEKLRHVAAGGHHPDEPFQPIQLLARHGTAQRLVQLAALLLDLRATKRKGENRKEKVSLRSRASARAKRRRRDEMRHRGGRWFLGPRPLAEILPTAGAEAGGGRP